MRRNALLAVWGLTLVAPPAVSSAPGDVIVLKDGTQIEGDVRKSEEGWTVRGADGTVTSVAADQVKSLEARRAATTTATRPSAAGPGGPTTKPAIDEPMQRLASLRRSLEGQSDVPKILERYRKFIEQHMGTAAADEAVKDVQTWEERLDRQMIKIGDKWVTREERGELHERGVEQATEVRQLLIQGRLKEATAALNSALAEYHANAAAHYLRGVVLFRQNQPALSRKAFEASLALAPNHGPTLNNVAVIMWGSKQYAGALNYYGQAMNASPGTRRMLDNVAEALSELPENQRDNAATKKVVLMFNAQDMALQGRMKKNGLYRWGSTWVDERELKALEAEEDKLEDKLDRLEDEFDDAQDRIEQIDRDIADTERSMRRIEATSYGRDAQGRVVKFSYPRLYYDLKRDVEELYEERASEKDKIARLKKRARAAQQELSVPRYTGVQQIIGVDGAPDLPPLVDADDEKEAKDAAAQAPQDEEADQP